MHTVSGAYQEPEWGQGHNFGAGFPLLEMETTTTIVVITEIETHSCSLNKTIKKIFNW